MNPHWAGKMTTATTMSSSNLIPLLSTNIAKPKKKKRKYEHMCRNADAPLAITSICKSTTFSPYKYATQTAASQVDKEDLRPF